ncbi:PIR Superfamily Protein [Plasmodium ovale wallikeri]|uniref:PIR Superfamily Protein n=1 Tax=Plasmodium ovale wallikeri TaxID=864142 RepID=A0A1A9ASR0_PLAOA|nr:PIR Superfamily Protein [Plasmodium ovale wallikeri]SBT59284.1 PIR Superfamily Protein [Plasmodium ovale wallikeri]
MHDFSKDYEKYKIELINADITCNENYKNNLDNHIENYKKLRSFCGIGKSKISTVAIQLLSDKGDRQLFPQGQPSGYNYVTQLYQADGTFPDGGSAPKTDNSITRHSQITTGVTFSA